MGTNYYSVKRDINYKSSIEFSFMELAETRGDSVIHIGKSSAGWCFSLHQSPKLGLNDLDDWIPVFVDPDRIIVDEYGRTITFLEMTNIITCRSIPAPTRWTPLEYMQNHAEPGPNNLARHSIGIGCDAHGSGTWDLITGGFS